MRLVFSEDRAVMRLGVRFFSGVRRVALPLSVAVAAAGSVALLPSSSLAQAEWTQRFDTGGLDEQRIVTSRPILSPETVAAVDQAILLYQGIVAAGGWPIVPADQPLRLGMQAPAVVILRQRLIIAGDLDRLAGLSDAFELVRRCRRAPLPGAARHSGRRHHRADHLRFAQCAR